MVAGVVAAFASLRNLDGDVDLPLRRRRRSAGLRAARPAASPRTSRRWPTATGSAALAADARSLRSSQATAMLAAGALAVVVLVDVAFPDAVGGLLISGVVVRIGIELIQAARPGHERIGGAELAAISEELAAGPPEVVGLRQGRRPHRGRRPAHRHRRHPAGRREAPADDGDRRGPADGRSAVVFQDAGSCCTYVNLIDPREKRAFANPPSTAVGWRVCETELGGWRQRC